jgi:hypothetical protein
MMVNLHKSYDFFKQIEDIFPNNQIDWLPENLNLPLKLIEPNSELSEKSTIKKLLENDDFPAIISPDHKKNRQIDDLGEIISRPPPQEEQNSEPVDDNISKKVKSDRKLCLKITKTIKKMKNIETFIKEESQARKECRKKALTKNLEQNQWKELKNMLMKKNKNYSLSKSKEILLSWIILPDLKGEINSPEFEKVKNKYLEK